MNRVVRKIFVAWAVMSIVIGLGGKLNAADTEYPAAPDNYIYDGARLIGDSDYQAITRLLTELDQKTSAQVAVVTVATTQPETIETYAANLLKKWGVGLKGKDNGVLFIVAKDDHKMRIEVGYGVEGALPDAICIRIINAIVVPEFKQSNFSGGVLKGTSAIVSLIAKEYNVVVTGQENDISNSVRSSQEESPSLLFFILLVVFILIFLSPFFIRRGYGGGYWSGGGGSSGGFGGGGGFSGGGFGGFGGGMSGGGGASGGW